MLISFWHSLEEVQERPLPRIATCWFSDLGGYRFAFALVEKLVQLQVESLGPLFQGLNLRLCVPALDARKVAAKEPTALFDVSLGIALGLAEFTQSCPDIHAVLTFSTPAKGMRCSELLGISLISFLEPVECGTRLVVGQFEVVSRLRGAPAPLLIGSWFMTVNADF